MSSVDPAPRMTRTISLEADPEHDPYGHVGPELGIEDRRFGVLGGGHDLHPA